MLTLYGVPVTAEDARHLVASLFADGSPAAMSAAAMIQKGLDRDLYAVALEPAERDAIAVLEEPPKGWPTCVACWHGISAADFRCQAFSSRPARRCVAHRVAHMPQQPQPHHEDRRKRMKMRCRRWESNPHSPEGTGF
jgi:hypothetical protein